MPTVFYLFHSHVVCKLDTFVSKAIAQSLVLLIAGARKDPSNYSEPCTRESVISILKRSHPEIVA